MMTLLHYKRLGYTFFGIGGVWDIALAELATELAAVLLIALQVVMS
jgi:hypothetical protein